MAQWTAATTLQRMAEIIHQETGINVLEFKPEERIVLPGSDEELTMTEVIALFKERIVKDSFHPGVRHESSKPRPPKPPAADGG